MPLLPDLGTAGLYAGATFLVILGLLVVFVETVRPSRFLGVVVASVLAACGLVLLGEPGLALIALGVGAALVANHVFDWLTTR